MFFVKQKHDLLHGCKVLLAKDWTSSTLALMGKGLSGKSSSVGVGVGMVDMIDGRGVMSIKADEVFGSSRQSKTKRKAFLDRFSR